MLPDENEVNHIWNIVYVTYPRFLRVLEKMKFHNTRQDYLIGSLKKSQDVKKIRAFLKSKGYEDGVLAWRDPSEVLGMRKLENKVFQYHVRVFDDGEVRCHYEYSPEGNPWGHVREKCFEPRSTYFRKLLSRFIQAT